MEVKCAVIVLVISAMLIQHCTANLNLYLTNAEVRRILGLKAELYYVREGVVNEYAMGWVVPVAADVHALHFTWMATDNNPLLYNMAVWVKNNTAEKHKVLGDPHVNISQSGSVPHHPTTFTLHLPCTGAASAEVDVILNINVTSPRPSQSPTELHFKRRKICLQGQSSEAYAPHLDPMQEADPLAPQTLYYGLCGAGAIIVVVSSLFCAALVRRRVRQNRHRDHCTLTSNCDDQKTRSATATSLLSPTNVYTPTNHTSSSYTSSTFTPSTHTFTPSTHTFTPSAHTYTLPSSTTSNCYASLTQLPIIASQANNGIHHLTLPRTPASVQSSRDCTLTTAASRDSSLSRRELLVDPCTALLREQCKHMQVDRRRVKLTNVLVEGRFRRMYKGCIEADPPHLNTPVLVKTVQQSATQQQVRQLCRDVLHLATLQHRCLLPLAAISAGTASPLLIFPDRGYHNLKLYLRNRNTQLSTVELQEVALQAAQGLAFLHSCNILHCDIAARNCVITEQLQLRLTDSALASDLFPEDYQSTPDSSARRPFAWMAIEAITEGVAAQPADVWSWAVLAWELSSLAQPPYHDLPLPSLPHYLRDGYRLTQPSSCPDVLYQLCAFCWAISPQHRPRAALLVEYLLGLHTTQQQTLSLLPGTLPGEMQRPLTSSASLDIKGITHQFHSCSPSLSSFSSQLAPLYCKPAAAACNDQLTSAVYSTPTLSWPPPPPLPPANGSAPRIPRPPQPLPNNTVIL